MRVGDKIYCKKSMKSIKTGDVILKSGNYYIVTQVDSNSIIIETEKYYYRFIHSNHPYIDYDIYHKFNDYFLTANDYRKLKLQKLNVCK